MANFCTLNPIAKYDSTVTLSQGNLRCDIGSTGGSRVFGTHYMTSGKWYCEIVNNIATNYHHPGIHSYGTTPGAITNDSTNGRIVWRNDGNVYIDGSLGASITTFGSGDVIGIAVDMDNGKLYYYKNGSNVSGSGHSITGYQTRGYTFHGLYNANAGWTLWNFGQFPWRYDPPSGFVALSTENLAEPPISNLAAEKPEDYFNTVLYTGTGSAVTVDSLSFQPDLVWIKNRSAVQNHGLIDVVRGTSSVLFADDASGAGSESTGMTFNSDGFTTSSNSLFTNNTNNYVAWCWKAGGAAVSNTDGSLTSQVSANTDAGFSIVSWTQTTNYVTSTVGHGLSSAPELMILKDINGSTGWRVYHHSLGNTKAVQLHNTSAVYDTSNWNNTTPTSSVFTLGGGDANEAENHIAYCWHSVEGFSSFGQYVGNGSTDGSFVYTGFRPAFVLIFKTAGGAFWTLMDNERPGYNNINYTLNPDRNATEVTSGGNGSVDFLSNGFKAINADSGVNANDATYIYMAFAESPYKYSSAR